MCRWLQTEIEYAERRHKFANCCSRVTLYIATLDAHERWDVATVDIPGAFMQADMVGDVHMKFEGKIADLLTKLEPHLYNKYLQTINGKSIIYMKLKKALYGTLQAAMLFLARS